MSASPEVIRYFAAEARECLDTLQPLVNAVIGPAEGVDVVAAARALRGSATIARFGRIADVAFAVEQIGGGLRDSEIGWTPMLSDALRATVADLRAFVDQAGDWGAQLDARAAATEASIRRWVPNAGRPTPPLPASSTQPVFVALQASAIASDLDALIRSADKGPVVDQLLSRVRIMQGIAGLSEYPPLPDVCDALERFARALVPDAPFTTVETELAVSAGALLRRASDELRSRVPPDANAPQVRRFADAVAAAEPKVTPPERVVQIDELFYRDAGPHVLSRPAAPRVSPERRFADEVVSRAEHVRRLIADARAAGDGLGRQRIRRDLATTLQALEQTARSFGAGQVAALCHDAGQRADMLAPLELDALEAAASILLAPAQSVDELERRVAVLARRTPASQAAQPHPSASKSRRTPTPTGKALQELLASSLAGLRGLSDQPFANRDESTDGDVVPVETLLYRGPAALQRAIQVRDLLRSHPVPDTDALAELYDLLDLAQSE